MKRLPLPKNKFLRLLINVVLIVVYYFVYSAITFELMFSRFDDYWYRLTNWLGAWGNLVLNLSIFLLPIFFITRYIWFEKSRKRTFYGLFDKFNFNVDLKKLEPRIYLNTSNADELKKYSDLRDQGIITEEEFQAKKKKLLDLLR